MATLAELKQDLNVSKLSFFAQTDAEDSKTEWLRARTINNDFVTVHEETLNLIKENLNMNNLYLKRKDDVVFQEEGKTRQTICRVFILCKSDKTPDAEI